MSAQDTNKWAPIPSETPAAMNKKTQREEQIALAVVILSATALVSMLLPLLLNLG